MFRGSAGTFASHLFQHLVIFCIRTSTRFMLYLYLFSYSLLSFWVKILAYCRILRRCQFFINLIGVAAMYSAFVSDTVVNCLQILTHLLLTPVLSSALFPFPFYLWRNRGSLRLSDSPKVILRHFICTRRQLIIFYSK